jgi:non-ribosomal peptide synthetase component F
VLFSAFAATLARLTGQSDFGVGVTVSRRAGLGIDDVVGCFVDTVCLRPRPDLDSGWPALLNGTIPVIRDGLAAQALPFGDVVRLVNPPRGRRSPLYQVLFVYQDFERPAESMAGHPMRGLPFPLRQVGCELVMEIWPVPDGGYTVDLTYQTAAITPEFVTGAGTAFAALLEG